MLTRTQINLIPFGLASRILLSHLIGVLEIFFFNVRSVLSSNINKLLFFLRRFWFSVIEVIGNYKENIVITC